MYEAVVVGTSAGGLQALKTLVSALPADFPAAVAVVQHLPDSSESYFSEVLARNSRLAVKEAEDKEFLLPGVVYLAPPGYHLLVEADRSFSLSVDARVNYSCPSIDVLFESAADVFREKLVGVVLTGANSDGSLGLKAVKAQGGLAVVQNPATAEARIMPQAALDAARPDYVLDLEQIAPLLSRMNELRGG